MHITFNKGEGLMDISDVRIRLVKKDENKLKAVASITINQCFVIHDIKVIEGNEGYFIAMPSRKTPDGEYKDIAHPINTETRDRVKKAVLDEFEKARKEQPAF
jgi:stage V sporulation protein G